MLVSAIVVSLILMSTFSTISDIQERTFSPTEQSYKINNIIDLGNQLDLAKKSDRKMFEENVRSIYSYGVDMEYLGGSNRRCYNMTLTESGNQVTLGCVGNGSVFHDGFEDGEYRDPLWDETESTGDVNAIALNRYPPNEGSKVVRLRETDSDNARLTLSWIENTPVWNGNWTAGGLFQIQKANLSSSNQAHSALLYYDNTSAGINVSLGVRDSTGGNRSFRIEGDLINNVETSYDPNWEEDTWYRWEVKHNGSGTYEGRLWEYGNGRPETPSAVSTGTVAAGIRHGALSINSNVDHTFSVEHAYFRLKDQ